MVPEIYLRKLTLTRHFWWEAHGSQEGCSSIESDSLVIGNKTIPQNFTSIKLGVSNLDVQYGLRFYGQQVWTWRPDQVKSKPFHLKPLALLGQNQRVRPLMELEVFDVILSAGTSTYLFIWPCRLTSVSQTTPPPSAMI